MAKSSTNSRTKTEQPSADDGVVREMRIDPAHRLGDGVKSQVEQPTDKVGEPHTDWEATLNAAEQALVQAWDEQQGPAFETESPALESSGAQLPTVTNNSTTATAVALNAQELQTWRSARTQLQQLAQLLAARQTDLDQREATVNARQAEVEEYARNLQRELRESQAEAIDRDAKLQSQQLAAEDRLAALATLELNQHAQLRSEQESLAQRTRELELREQRLREWEITLSQRTGQLELLEHRAEQAAAEQQEQRSALVVEAELLSRRADALRQLVREYLSGLTPTATQVHSSRAMLGISEPTWDDTSEWQGFSQEIQQLAARRERLAQAEASNERTMRELLEQRTALDQERTAWQQRQRAERRDLDQDREQLAIAHQQELQSQQSARADLIARREAVEMLQAELLDAQRELLQDRLSLEELLNQQLGQFPATRQAAAQLRARQRLSELYGLQIEQLTQERQQLETLLKSLPHEQATLERQRVQLETWLRDRQAELASVMQRLAERETELDQFAEQLQRQAHDWSSERLDYEQQIRRLLTELGE